METRIKKSLEIPAQKRKGHQTETRATAEKTFHMVVNLWIIRFEYTKEQSKT
ncbi:hypothetical protein PY092_08035 [Muricauda sp. 334s03]|uniref:Uncharacterized protein n=1 Tax=Flagellimonas yonaguniensis TaxID=3031325 RepID=A0ABT5XY23_9FLAO|nr:hypothetical protein [[Muricauda] yonaguniensis]MDF0716090.1 hypothetical protein [[Muricauda] yonaguniensis]